MTEEEDEPLTEEYLLAAGHDLGAYAAAARE